jgi:hypothetical protein
MPQGNLFNGVIKPRGENMFKINSVFVAASGEVLCWVVWSDGMETVEYLPWSWQMGVC